jgi:tetratricopeptide (TPR) repeat protein
MSVMPRRQAGRPSEAVVLLPEGQRPWIVQAMVVFAVALVLRGLHFWAMRDTRIYEVLIGDSWQYDRWAQRIAGGEWIGSEIFYQTPLYPYFLGVLYTLFGHSVWIARFAQALLGALACALLARAGTRYFDERVGWAAGLLLAAYPPAIFFDGILQKATLDLVLMCALLWMMSRVQHRATWRGLLATGAILGGLILNRENAWVLFPVVLAWLAWQTWGDVLTARLVRTAVLVAGMGLVLLPVGLRNYYVGGEFLLTTSQMGPNFYIGNHRGASGQYVSLRADRGDPRFESADARILAEQDLGRVLTPSEVSRYWMDRARSDISADFDGWLRLLAWKWFLTWNQVEVIDGEGIRVHEQFSPPLYVLSSVLDFGILCPVAVIGAWLTRRDWRRLWPLYALTLAFALAVTLFYVFARYRYPLVPMVVMFAAAGFVWGWQALRSTDRLLRRDLWKALAIALPLAVATCWPLPSLHSDEVTYFNVGTALSDENRPADAIELLKRAIEIKPDFAAAYNNLGIAETNQRHFAEAEIYLRKAIELSPRSANAYVNLAKAKQDQGDLAAAETLLKTAIELDPYLLAGYQGLSQIAARQGRTQEAVNYMQQAVAIDRNSAQAHADLGMAQLANRQLAKAVASLSNAVEQNPQLLGPANNLAWVLATGPEGIRDGKRALALAERICQATDFKEAEFLDTLAAAYAELGDFRRAADTARQAADLARAAGKRETAEGLTGRAELYAKGQPFRDPQLSSDSQ